LGELIDFHPEVMSPDGKRFAQIGDLFKSNQETRTNFPIGEPSQKNKELSSPTRRNLSGKPTPADLSIGTDSLESKATRSTQSPYRNMWHLDETLSSFQKVTESMPAESLDPALIAFQHAVELVPVDSGSGYSEKDNRSIKTSSASRAETCQTVSKSILQKPLEFVIVETAPEFGGSPGVEPSKDQPLAEPAAPTITRINTRAQVEAGKIEKDILTYQTVVGINPKNSRAWHTLGNLQRSAGQYDQAAISLEKAVEINPNQEVFHYHLGLVYAAQNRLEEAIETFKKVIQINPEYNLAHATLAGYYKKLGMSEDSKYHLAIAKRSMQDENEYNNACFEAICGNVDKAIELLKIALKEGQTNPDWVSRDPDFESIRSDERFQALIAG
jgi:Flp pilus assembly protein TadD